MAEASIHIAGKDIFAKAEADNLYAALDALADKIDRQLDKIHQKHIGKKGSQKPVVDEEALSPA
jgi:putative sigma-54 modulation protein